VRIHFTIVFLAATSLCSAQNFHSGNFENLQKRIASENDTLYILNFWATWCKPCIEEIGYFDKTGVEHDTRKLKMILINLDFNKQVESSVKPFIKRKKLRSEIYHITDTDPNEWINRIDSIWSGAIPATVMYANGVKLFFKEGSMKEDEIKSAIERSAAKLKEQE
jgi:thiol-disulfide isomerase/thioredoxin